MTEETNRVVREIRQRTQAVTSFVAAYTSVYAMQLMPFEATGKMHFRSPDLFRAETVVNGHEIVMIRKGSKVRRYVAKRNEVWTYDLNEWLQADPLNFGVADIRDPFFAVDEATMSYKGTVTAGESSEHRFDARIKFAKQAGLLDTRKGFSIRYQAKGPAIAVHIDVDSETGLLHTMTAIENQAKVVFQLGYHIDAINVPIDDSVFEFDESIAACKTIDVSEMLMASLNPNAADEPPSLN
jgi:outer membrane lipoprotein-sorting protein